MKGWLKPKSAAKYCDVGERTLRTWLKKKDCVKSGYDPIPEHIEAELETLAGQVSPSGGEL